MTKEEILSKEAGEKLDAFVAEIVMEIQGWFKYSNGYHPKASPYSTDILAAWPIAEKLHLAVFSVCIDGHWKWACCKNYNVSSPERVLNWVGELVVCEEAPEAICKAALLAKLKL